MRKKGVYKNEREKNPLQNLFRGRRDAKAVVQCPRRYEEEASTIVKSRNIITYDLKRIIKCIL